MRPKCLAVHATMLRACQVNSDRWKLRAFVLDMDASGEAKSKIFPAVTVYAGADKQATHDWTMSLVALSSGMVRKSLCFRVRRRHARDSFRIPFDKGLERE